MSRLSKDQKLEKRWKKYYDCIDAKDAKQYGVYQGADGYWHIPINGYPTPQEFTRKYNGAKRQIRRNRKK